MITLSFYLGKTLNFSVTVTKLETPIPLSK